MVFWTELFRSTGMHQVKGWAFIGVVALGGLGVATAQEPPAGPPGLRVSELRHVACPEGQVGSRTELRFILVNPRNRQERMGDGQPTPWMPSENHCLDAEKARHLQRGYRHGAQPAPTTPTQAPEPKSGSQGEQL